MTGIVVITAVEVASLAIWLTFVQRGLPIVGIVVLAVGLIVEHLLSYNVINRRGLLQLAGLPVAKKALVSLIETGIWALWLTLAGLTLLPQPNLNVILAAVVLAVLLVVEHSLSDNVFKDKGLFSRLADGRTISFSIIEAVGATIWLALVQDNLAVVGIAVLTVGALIEHTMAVALGRRRTP